MGRSLSAAVDALRAPAYTGRNRCRPCTALNLALVAAAAGLAALRTLAAGVLVAAVGVAAVWLRGYVVPGTPRLTRRYLPDSVLAVLGKRQRDRGLESAAGAAALDATDPTASLVELGVLEDADPPSLAPSFRSRWAATAASLSASPAAVRRAVADTLSASADSVAVSSRERGVAVTVDGDWAGELPSRTALVADLATERVLAATAWTELDRVQRASLAARVRAVAERCPVCGGATKVAEDTVESCCREADVVAVTCPACEARLAEFEPSRDAFAPGR
ncbi:uncharacterized protein HHUB_1332 [Halobacterium hubeiense]|uniref:Uncharacterized protein n=1 Tax=Halobacterium hubeiense TaxID=1407499 RepID=A0A0U5H1A0_9EURY|nr:hypothetical protein [Halobacterium hubeiense]CQH47539.1 uncharacterized protein HHUB_1332 [Halobacterium hubeiense]